MFKEMTTKKKIIIGVIVLAVIIICIILFIKSRNKKKQAAAKAEESIQTVSAPVVVEKEKKRSQIVPEEDMQAVKTTSEAKLSVEEVIPAKEPVAATAPQVNNGNMKEGKPAVMQTSALPPEFMINANNPSA